MADKVSNCAEHVAQDITKGAKTLFLLGGFPFGCHLTFLCQSFDRLLDETLRLRLPYFDQAELNKLLGVFGTGESCHSHVRVTNKDNLPCAILSNRSWIRCRHGR